MFSSNTMCKSLLHIISNIEINRERKNEIDTIYSNTVDVLISEMNVKLPYIDVNCKIKKYFKSHKPFWDEKPFNLWKTTHSREKEFLYSRVNRSTKRMLHASYKTAQKEFDKYFRSCGRKYSQSQIENIESKCLNDLKDFRKYLKTVGPFQ